LAGKVAIITGASRGIGAATARVCAREGARVVVNYNRYREGAEAVAAAIIADGGEAITCQADVAQRGDVRQLVERTVEAFGRIDVLVNNAGVAQHVRSIMDVTEADWQRMLAVNLSGVLYTVQAVYPLMRAQGYGSIVNLASIGVRVGTIAGAHYAATKGGVVALTLSLAKEFGPHGVRINCVAPPLVETDMGRGAFTLIDRDEYVRGTPLRRIGTAEDVAEVVAFVASDRSAYLTGETIWVSGGR
jgi:3-oxoacyl-[acyl-carrier protein] reductase